MSDHDSRCPMYGTSRWIAWWQMRVCECVLIRVVRADEDEKIAQALEVFDFLDGDEAADIARSGGIRA